MAVPKKKRFKILSVPMSKPNMSLQGRYISSAFLKPNTTKKKLHLTQYYGYLKFFNLV